MIELKAGEVLRLRDSALHLECVSGVLWVTREGDPRDLFVVTGESMRIAGRGLVLVQAWEPAVVDVRRVGSHPTWWLGRWCILRGGHATCRPAPK